MRRLQTSNFLKNKFVFTSSQICESFTNKAISRICQANDTSSKRKVLGELFCNSYRNFSYKKWPTIFTS